MVIVLPNLLIRAGLSSPLVSLATLGCSLLIALLVLLPPSPPLPDRILDKAQTHLIKPAEGVSAPSRFFCG